MNLKKIERYLRVNLLGPGPRLLEKEFMGLGSHKGTPIHKCADTLYDYAIINY